MSGSSLAVSQFVSVAFGWIPVHAPATPWKVLEVRHEERYCLGCFGVRNFDVVIGEVKSVAFCRCCGKEM